MIENVDKEKVYRELSEARSDWHLAVRQFDYAEENDAIDAAIFKIKAAERKYMYLLKKYEHFIQSERVAEKLNQVDEIKDLIVDKKISNEE